MFEQDRSRLFEKERSLPFEQERSPLFEQGRDLPCSNRGGSRLFEQEISPGRTRDISAVRTLEISLVRTGKIFCSSSEDFLFEQGRSLLRDIRGTSVGRMFAGCPTDVRRTSDGRPSDVQQTSGGRPTDVRVPRVCEHTNSIG